MTRIVILEDEAPARQRLEEAIRRVDPHATVVACLAAVDQAVAWFEREPAPDLVLADIQLADGLSLEIFDRIELACPVVFCTAYDEYVIEALSRGGIGYLLKPIRDADVAGALAKYRRLEAHFGESVRAAARALTRTPRRLLVRQNDGFVALGVEQVAYFAVEGKLCTVITRDGARFDVDRPLAELEAELDPSDFFRVNRQYLVHASAVAGFRPFIKGKLLVDLVPPPGDELDVIVSQENAPRFRAWLRG